MKPWLGQIEETAGYVENAIERLSGDEGRIHEAAAALQQAAGMYALYFGSDSTYSENLQMFRDALDAARTEVRPEQVQQVTEKLTEWVRAADRIVLDEDMFEEKYRTRP